MRPAGQDGGTGPSRSVAGSPRDRLAFAGVAWWSHGVRPAGGGPVRVVERGAGVALQRRGAGCLRGVRRKSAGHGAGLVRCASAEVRARRGVGRRRRAWRVRRAVRMRLSGHRRRRPASDRRDVGPGRCPGLRLLSPATRAYRCPHRPGDVPHGPGPYRKRRTPRTGPLSPGRRGCRTAARRVGRRTGRTWCSPRPEEGHCSFRGGCRILEVWSSSGTSRSSGRGGRKG